MSGNKALIQENNTLLLCEAVKWLINLLPVPLNLQNQGNTSKKPFRGLVLASESWGWVSKNLLNKTIVLSIVCWNRWKERNGNATGGVSMTEDRYVYIESRCTSELNCANSPQLLLSLAKITNSSQTWNQLIWSLLWQKEWKASFLPLTQTANQKQHLWIPH